MVQRQASLLSFVEVFRIMAIMFLSCTVLILLMQKTRRHRGGGAVAH
jgi:hypothetical protein